MPNTLVDQFINQIGPNMLQGLAEKTGATTSQVQSAVKFGAPSLLSGVINNATSQGGVSRLLGALQEHAGGGSADSMLDQLKSGVLQNEGAKIVTHLLGNQKSTVIDAITKSAGTSQAQATNLLSSLAPMLMAFLGNRLNANGGFNVSSLLQLLPKQEGLAGMLGGLLGNGGGSSAVSSGLNLLSGLLKK